MENNEIAESVVWKGRSSQIVNFWPFVISLLVIAAFIGGVILFPPLVIGAIIPLGYAGWIWLQTRARIFEFTSERIRIYEGVLNQDIDEVELYRVKDTRIQRPFWLRLFGLSTLVLNTSDRSCPTVELKAIRDAAAIREKLRKQVEMLRDKKRVREVDFEGGDDAGEMDDFDMA
ncbi:PH domain-containing protein [bacterium]|nr:PH domain-containing protein [Akkermansiaceae bacterium]MDB4587945.1 PH domain-containing protein [bacterium]MDB4293758.1 PH domain-containing protein [Akkermansiaceae bacterium]MDB4295876.1 PH domain-containing protein [Akkermansiaceae bacterium]MDB4429367.1 PH domain-containing protein [Akkermansiaceae bacterium]